MAERRELLSGLARKEPAQENGNTRDGVTVRVVLEHGFQPDFIPGRNHDLPGKSECVPNGEDVSRLGIINDIVWFLCQGSRLMP